MRIPTEFGALLKAARDATLSTSQQWTLGMLIDACEAIERRGYRLHDGSEPEVVFAFEYARPTGIDSWRGIYAELALEFGFEDRKAMSLSEFISMLRRADGETFTGYKGGEYRMSRSTPVWVANYGNSGNTGVIGVRDEGYEVVIETAWCPT